MRRRKIFCICFAFCLWISSFTAVSADDAYEPDMMSGLTDLMPRLTKL